MSRVGLALVLTGVLLNAIAQFCLKAATQDSGPIALNAGGVTLGLARVAMVPAFWVGCLCYALSVVVWILALSRVPVSVAYPMLSLGYVAVAFITWGFMGEALTATKLTGIGVIILGVIILFRA